MSNETALQRILAGPEQATEIRNALERMLEEAEDDPDAQWELKLLVEADDLPVLLDEVAEVADGDE